MDKLRQIITLWYHTGTNITHVFGLLAIVIGVSLFIYDVRYLVLFEDGWEYLNNIIVEAHGLLFDLLVLGVLISIYERRRQKKEGIAQERNLIDDFRGWDEKEAMFRIVGAIRRLNDFKEFEIDLRFCFLQKAQLSNKIFIRSNLQNANLQNATLFRAIMLECDLRDANLEDADFRSVNFGGSHLGNAVLKKGNFWGASFNGVDLRGANFENATLVEANFLNARVESDWFIKLEEMSPIGLKEIKEHYYIDDEGRLKLK